MIEKEHLNFVIVGHVDHGKSTLIGRLLYDTDSIPESIISEVEASSKEIGKKMEFAYLLDSLKEEREQNITIDTTQTFFNTTKRDYIIIDAPGHKEFLRNMITGASLASAAILMIDAKLGLEEQTRRHAYILSLLGVKQIIVAVNKMDLVDYSQEVYAQMKEEIEVFLSRISLSPLHVIPVSAQMGDNIAKASDNMSWYEGEILLSALDSLVAPESMNKKALRFPIQDVYSIDDKQVYVGKVESGIIKKGNEIELYPSNKKAKVESIEVWQQRRVKAQTGDAIGLTLDSNDDLKRGEVVCSGEQPAVSSNLDSTIFWMDNEGHNIDETLTLKCATQECPCKISEITSRVDSSSLEVLGEKCQEIGEAEAGKVRIETKTPIVVEDFNHIQGLGRFVLVRNDDIVAGGIVQGWK